MPHPRRTLLRSVALAAVGALTTSLLATAAPATAADEPRAPDAPLLAAPAQGQRALTALGDDLGEAARLNAMSADELTEVLLDDPSMWLDREGHLYAVDPGRDATGLTRADRDETAVAQALLADTFTLHSRPGAAGTVYLDVDGVTLTSGLWVSSGLSPGTYEGWDPAGNGAAFSDAEKLMVQEVWARVAEDFAPFDIDVTTEQPSGTWRGSHAVISDSSQAHAQLCASGCGGIAYVGVWGTSTTARPAWTLTRGGLTTAKSVAEATTHEVGHNLGLKHHGTSTSGYYGGHGTWAPIMGVGYSRAVTQWSNGSYPNANNSSQDDVAVIAGRAGTVSDDAPDTVAAATSGTPATSGSGTISSRADVDVIDLGNCVGTVGIDVQPATQGPNLDIEARLLTADGTTVQTMNPSASLAASGSATVAGGRHFLQVDGIGAGSPSTSYDDYGSLGAYTWTVTGCDQGPVAVTPSSPVDVTATYRPTTGAVLLRWSAPLDDGGSAVTGYRAQVSDRTRNLGSDVREIRFPGLTPGTYEVTLRALNAVGPGEPVTVTVTVTAPDPTRTVLSASSYGPEVTFSTRVITSSGVTAQGTVVISSGGENLVAIQMSGGSATWTRSGTPLGTASYTATYVPIDQRWATSTSDSVDVTVTEAPVKVRPVVRVKAPTSTTVGSRPRVVVRVRAAGAPATGKVRVRYGTRTVAVRLVNGRAVLRLGAVRPAWVTKGRLAVRVRYLGNATTKARGLVRIIRVKSSG